MVYALLALAIVSEVTGTVALRFSEGFSKPIPSVITVVAYLAAFAILAQVLNRGMAVGVAYGIWAASGVALVALIGALFLGEGLTWIQAGGIGLVIAGVLALELGAAH
ncbi:DMT family transporter [Nocardiopsis ansamitocini]|uniref:Cation transporter n=1 Tax=Nocardiopsis ansamitocini TaxID=1670832 RepID=A0A9W6P2U2_9ACTN|nr:multidrug efflux SMR transporter [Nocardiopsis ansamitocini]GLU46121.1 cation transporter [Nocardiopsis ansamitocini]